MTAGRKRLSPHHQLVYEVVQAQPPGRHIAAGDIYAEAKARRSGLGYSTVYRALRRLCEFGLVRERQLPGMNATLYEPDRSGDARLVCAACGRTIPARPGPPPAGDPCAGAVIVQGRCLDC